MVSSNYFAKFHDFSMIIQVFSKIHDFFIRGTFFVIFQVFREFQSLWEPSRLQSVIVVFSGHAHFLYLNTSFGYCLCEVTELLLTPMLYSFNNIFLLVFIRSISSNE